LIQEPSIWTFNSETSQLAVHSTHQNVTKLVFEYLALW
jgi:hypothetical protein